MSEMAPPERLPRHSGRNQNRFTPAATPVVPGVDGLSAGVGLDNQSQSQHVHAHCAFGTAYPIVRATAVPGFSSFLPDACDRLRLLKSRRSYSVGLVWVRCSNSARSQTRSSILSLDLLPKRRVIRADGRDEDYR
jgi:hypothetical protein